MPQLFFPCGSDADGGKGQGVDGDVAEGCLSQEFGEVDFFPLLDGMGQVIPGAGGAGNPAGRKRHDMAQVKLMDTSQEFVLGQKKFEDADFAAGLEQAMYFFECSIDITDIAQAEGAGDQVK